MGERSEVASCDVRHRIVQVIVLNCRGGRKREIVIRSVGLGHCGARRVIDNNTAGLRRDGCPNSVGAECVILRNGLASGRGLPVVIIVDLLEQDRETSCTGKAIAPDVTIFGLFRLSILSGIGFQQAERVIPGFGDRAYWSRSVAPVVVENGLLRWNTRRDRPVRKIVTASAAADRRIVVYNKGALPC